MNPNTKQHLIIPEVLDVHGAPMASQQRRGGVRETVARCIHAITGGILVTVGLIFSLILGSLIFLATGIALAFGYLFVRLMFWRLRKTHGEQWTVINKAEGPESEENNPNASGPIQGRIFIKTHTHRGWFEP